MIYFPELTSSLPEMHRSLLEMGNCKRRLQRQGLRWEDLLDTLWDLERLDGDQDSRALASGRRDGALGLRQGQGRGAEDGLCSVARKEGNSFRVALNVRNYQPEELSVAVDGDTVTVRGNHEEQKPDGFVSRHFTRKYQLPPEARLSEIRSSLGADGTLAIEVPLQAPALPAGERRIPITFTHSGGQSPASDAGQPAANGEGDGHSPVPQVA